MRLTIFWRVILAQSAPIALILAVSLYTLCQLYQLVQISSDILTNSAARIEIEKHLQHIFFMQMRQAEKYVLFQDKAFYQHFAEGHRDFVEKLGKLRLLLDSPADVAILEGVKEIHTRYATGLSTALQHKNTWSQEKDELSDRLTAHLNALIRSHEETIARKTAVTRDQAAMAAWVVQWLSVGGLSVVVLLAYGHARGLSRPLTTLAQALRRVGRGEFQAALRLHASKEVTELAGSFNWMAFKLAELDRMKSEFIAHVSHELRTPITGIREGTALLLEQVPGPLTPGQYQVLTVVQTHCERLWHHIASILDLSKMDAGMMEYVRVPGDLMALIRRSVDTIQLMAQKKQTQVKVLGSPVLPLLVMDARRMQQVLDNLVSNAVKFTPPHGTVSITARLLPPGAADGAWVEVLVSDTGVGIPSADQQRIFEKFYQSPHHREAHQMGTGLGLAMVRHIVEAHGGTISVESRIGKGTTFRFTLPLQAQEAQHGLTVPHPMHGTEAGMRQSQKRTEYAHHLAGIGLLCTLLVAGCTSGALPQRYPVFPPQEAMEQGDYATFRTTNLLLVEQCNASPGCEIALFNLGFIYAYPASPYYNPVEALQYFGTLVEKYPHTPWAAQGQAWMALLKEQHAFLPSQGVVTHEDYERFRTINMQMVDRCTSVGHCDMALFNLGFVHAYPASPYYNPVEALQYFGTLVEKYPHTPWAAQGNIWITLLKEQYALEERQRRLQAELRTQQQAIRSKESAIRTKESAIRTQETVLRTKDATIRTLQEQLDRARDIDAEIDKKERALLR